LPCLIMLRSALFAAAVSLALADDYDCSSCLQDNSDVMDGSKPLSDLKAWCYSTSSCVELDSTAKAISFFAGGCPDYTFDAGTCLCRPDVYTSCGKCATAEHLGCIWMANASVSSSINYTVLGVKSYTKYPTSYWKSGRCVKGSGFSPEGLESSVTYTATGFSFTYDKVVKPNDWYWGQCTVNGPTMAGLAIGVSILGCCLCCAVACCIARCTRKRQRLEEFNNSGLLR